MELNEYDYTVLEGAAEFLETKDMEYLASQIRMVIRKIKRDD